MWWFLSAAIASEVVATLALKSSEGFTRGAPALMSVAGYALAFWALSQALARGMPVGTAYAVWAGAGVALVAALGLALFGERLTLLQVLGLVAVIGGVVAIELGHGGA